MRKILFFAIIWILALSFASCSIVDNSLTRGNQYPKMYEDKPLTMLIMPPINNTNHVEAKDLLYTSIAIPVAEAGYYVISPILSMEILKAESAYDAELFIDGKLDKFKQFFGADAVIFSIIDVWEKQGFGISTTLHYIIKSTATNEIIFDRTCELYLDLSITDNDSSMTSMLASLTASIINTALTKHIEAARKTNNYIFLDIPRGPYSPDYENDMDIAADKKDIRRTIK